MEISKEKLNKKLDELKISTIEVADSAMVLARQHTSKDWRRRMQQQLDRHAQLVEELAFALKLLPPVAEGSQVVDTDGGPIDKAAEGNAPDGAKVEGVTDGNETGQKTQEGTEGSSAEGDTSASAGPDGGQKYQPVPTANGEGSQTDVASKPEGDSTSGDSQPRGVSGAVQSNLRQSGLASRRLGKG